MKVKNKTMVAGVLASAAAMTALGTGVAHAADPQKPTVDYQLCGNVRDSSGNGVGGVSITGELWKPGPTSVATYTTTTAPDGGYCIQGTSNLVSDIQSQSGWVTLAGTKAGTAVNFGAWGGMPGIQLGDFLVRWDIPLQSASGFDGVY